MNCPHLNLKQKWFRRYNYNKLIKMQKIFITQLKPDNSKYKLTACSGGDDPEIILILLILLLQTVARWYYEWWF